ncbi:MAG: Fic family protein [Bernardetiaceae bacterium]|nr:Fic family protein [Bernardetiaceae bacterium]
MWTQLTQLNRAYKKLNLHDVIDYEKFCIISIVWHSTKIEGCSLTETDTKVLLEKDITAAGKPLQDHLMIKDHYAAFEYIQKEAQQKRKLSLDFIQEIGGLVMKNTGSFTHTALGSFDTSKGDLRLAQVYVDKKYFPDYKKVPNLLAQLCKSVNEKIDAVKDTESVLKLSADVHYNFVNIHAFGDGNGRVSRLLMNYIQLYHGEPLIKIFTEDRVAYIDALNETEEKKDLEIFRQFIAKQEVKFLKAEIDKYQKLDKEFMLMF